MQSTKFQREYSNLTIPQLLQKLDELYELEEKLLKNSRYIYDCLFELKRKYEQLQEDKNMLEVVIAYKSNKKRRMNQ